MSVHSDFNTFFSGASFLNTFNLEEDQLFSQLLDSATLFTSSGINSQDIRDEQLVKHFSKNIISGFLNLSESQGWPEGHDNRLGAAFTRFILKKYYAEGKERLGKYKPVFEKAINAFRETGKMVSSPFDKEIVDAHRPKTSRAAYDCAVTGWQKHAVCRLVGNVASEYGSSKPFFEILVNSQRTSYDDPLCQPFFITIHNNEVELDKRRQTLASFKALPSVLAHSTFYTTDHLKPAEFYEKYSDKIGPNSKRILEGLTFLQETTIKAQTTGNCWIKQPMRCLLATLYLELLSVEKEKTPKETWEMAKEFYLCIQRATAIPYVESLLHNEKVSSEMLQNASAALEKRKTL